MMKQEAYERVRAYLTRPGARRAYSSEPVPAFREGICRYETVIDGEKHRCAVGCLLEQEDLDRSMATFIGSVQDLFDRYGVPDYLADLIDYEDEDDGGYAFLERLQSQHDNEMNWTPQGFDPSGLDRVAEEYGLEVVA